MNETDSALPAPVQDALAKAKKTFAGLGGVALLVGVESYLAYDSTGKKNLLSGRNDVLAYWKVCRRLGYKAEHIRVLTSPKLRMQDLLWAEQELAPELGSDETEQQIEDRVKGWLSGEAPSVVLDEATADEIRRGLEWLAEELVFTVKLRSGSVKIEEEWAALPGIFTYSGHGTPLDGDLGLCPSDLGPARENVLSFAELGAILDKGDDLPGGAHPTDNLTIVLDCCFAAAIQPRSRALRVPSLAAGGGKNGLAPASKPVSKREIGRRVLCASAREGQSHQALLGGYWYGAFTWALTVALEQWKIEREGQWKRSTVSHGELLSRAKKLLSALSFPQEPILVDEEKIGSLPVFHHGPADGGETSPTPDGRRPGSQIDPLGDYKFTEFSFWNYGVKVAGVIVPNGDQRIGDVTWYTAKEYWYVLQEFDTRSGSWAFNVQGSNDAPTIPQSNCGTVDRATTWDPTARQYTPDRMWKRPDGSFNFAFSAKASKTFNGSQYVYSCVTTWFQGWWPILNNLNFTGSPWFNNQIYAMEIGSQVSCYSSRTDSFTAPIPV
jgi:hypothetical protein